MSRDIKFRVWNLYSGEHSMWDWDKMLSHEDNEPGWLRNVFNSQYEDCHIMQYTGLKDKNGTEIYESDYVACTGGYESSECESPGTVKWEDAAWIVECEMHEHKVLLSEYDIDKVIGNIYENPGLLKGEE